MDKTKDEEKKKKQKENKRYNKRFEDFITLGDLGIDKVKFGFNVELKMKKEKMKKIEPNIKNIRKNFMDPVKGVKIKEVKKLKNFVNQEEQTKNKENNVKYKNLFPPNGEVHGIDISDNTGQIKQKDMYPDDPIFDKYLGKLLNNEQESIDKETKSEKNRNLDLPQNKLSGKTNDNQMEGTITGDPKILIYLLSCEIL